MTSKETAPRSDNFRDHPWNPQEDFLDNTATNLARPVTDAVITIRLIKSFEYRTMKPLVLQHCDLTKMTVASLEERCKHEVRSTPAFKAFRNAVDKLDTLKLYTRAHGAKTTNLIINTDHPEYILANEGDQGRSLAELGIENETELSMFNRAEYEAYLEHPETRW